MEFATLPIFRVMGISQTVVRTDAITTAQQLQQQWLASPPHMAGFSQTLYCVYQYPDENKVKITLGKLVANDATLPENLSDAWIAPQNYAVFTIASNALETWLHIPQQSELNRRFHADFETYPHYGAAKIYVGLVGDVRIIEE